VPSHVRCPYVVPPRIHDVMLHARSSWNEDALVPVFRNGRIEEVYWTYGYSPEFDDDGKIGGTLVVCTETTERVLADRRARATPPSTHRRTGASGSTLAAWTARSSCGSGTTASALPRTC
jgi:hypothetical protein